MSSIKKIGVLTSGGDAPGMNAVIRAVTRTAIEHGIEVVGIRRGYAGLISGDLINLSIRSVTGIIKAGGTFLYTARSLEFREEPGILKAVDTCKKNGIEGIVAIGGDGTFRGAADLSKHGIPCIGIPGTIDNDIAASEYTIGFDTSVNCVMDMVDRLRDTMESHERCSVVEVMGRGAGYIALHSGIATGATCVLIPEIKTSYEDILEKIEKSKATGKTHFIIIIAEGVGGSEQLTKRIESDTGITTRCTILGHVQRGGSPTVRDRVMASHMGHYAVELLREGKGNRVIVYQHGAIKDVDIHEALNVKKQFPMDLYQVCMDISN